MKKVELYESAYMAISGICPRATDGDDLIATAKRVLRAWNEHHTQIDVLDAVKLAAFAYSQSSRDREA